MGIRYALRQELRADRYDVTLNNKTYTADTVKKIIYDGPYTYRYEFSGDSENYDFKVYYPNGAWYSLHRSGVMVAGNFSDNYREGRYASPYILRM